MMFFIEFVCIDDADERLKAEIARAEERMTLKHGNTSKWAKQALARGWSNLHFEWQSISELWVGVVCD